MAEPTSTHLEREASALLASHGYTREAKPVHWAPRNDAMAYIISHDWDTDQFTDEDAV